MYIRHIALTFLYIRKFTHKQTKPSTIMAATKLAPQRPNFGRRLMPEILDDEARENPHRVFAATAKSTDLAQGFQNVSFAEMANAVNFVAHQIQTQFGRELDDGIPTLTYIGVPDLRYNIVFYAAVKSGWKVRPRPWGCRPSKLIKFMSRFFFHHGILWLPMFH